MASTTISSLPPMTSLPPSISTCVRSPFARSSLSKSIPRPSLAMPKLTTPSTTSRIVPSTTSVLTPAVPALPPFIRKFPTKIAFLALSVIVVRLYPTARVVGGGSATATAAVVVLIELVLYYIVYCMILVPAWLSPLGYLPTLAYDSLWTAQLGQMAANPIMLPTPQDIDRIAHSGLVRQVYAFNRERVIVASAEAMVEVLVTRTYEFCKPETVQNILIPFLGRGLITVDGAEHKKQRRHVSPAFALKHIKELYPLFLSKGRELCTELVRQNGLRDAEVSDWMNRVALDVVSVAAAGCDFSAIKKPENELTKAYYDAFSPSMVVIVVRILQYLSPPWLFSLLPVPGRATVQTASETIKEICRGCIRKKRQSQAARAVPVSSSKSGKLYPEDKDILSVAMRAGVFSDEELVWQLMTFFMAGHETTSTALSWAVYELCANRDMQDRLRAEIMTTIPNLMDANSNSPTSAADFDIEKMPYMSAIYNETLRIHPPVWLTVREVTCDTTIAGMPVPAGTDLILGMDIFNRCTTFWGPDAAVFNPERWLVPGQEMTGGAESRYMNLTFLYGQHGCIGKDFARGEFMCVLACLLTSFEIEFANPDYQVGLEFTGVVTRPRDLRVNFRPI